MKPASFWIIRLALTVQFLCVLSVPALVAANEAPRATWMAEWVREHSIERTIGVLRLRDNKLTFTEQNGNADWELELASVKKVSTLSGRALQIESIAGDIYVVRIFEANFAPGNPKRAQSTLERAIESLAATNR
jgi:hypothetical protein